ncbi:MAG TPA: tetratricopeptide repeat protein [Rhodopila sp.]|uniref:tetratricopeptide repeat-containing glycosyltransferase family protein n=1 Tax=Rhodopila sp. TaxID=2480087 RepID=UPI002C4AB650|nr:tetratricopeptide repeat protein [Rhodopila sp.]HVY13854.1 tetratricopeptide repeat protein [Rhodopila sp.]
MPDDIYVDALTTLRDGDPAEAADLLLRALRRQPGHAGIRRNLVRALVAAGRFAQALPHADAALAADPRDAELHFLRGTTLNALGFPTRACAAFHNAVMLKAEHAPSWLNWGNASADLDDLDAAEAMYRTALSFDPALPEAQASLGYVLTRQGRLPEAIKACNAALRSRPEMAEAHWNRAIALLLSGNLPAGFAAYEWRKRHPAYRGAFPPLPAPEWDGRALEGRTVLVRGEQGAGDAIHFARFLAAIRDRGGRPILACGPALVPVIGLMPGTQTCAWSESVPHDVWIDQMSLPFRLGITEASIPAAGGYLTADPVRVAAWAQQLGPGRHVGLALAGNPANPTNHRRSVPAALMRALPAIDRVRFVSLQHGSAARSLPLSDLTTALPDYAETAALIAALDLVISVDTSVAHLAGALGKPVWLLLPADPDWRWMLGRSDTPWYASMRLFRQDRRGDWAPLLERVFGELTTW